MAGRAPSLSSNSGDTEIDNLAPEDLRTILEKNQFKRLPIIEDGKVTGFLTREEMQSAIEEARPPRLEKVATCRRSFTIARWAVVD